MATKSDSNTLPLSSPKCASKALLNQRHNHYYSSFHPRLQHYFTPQ